MDPLLATAAAAVAGALARVAPGPVALVVCVALVAARLARARRLGRAWLVTSSVIALLSAGRAHAELAGEEARSALAVGAMPHPARCALRGVVATMPLRRGVLRADLAVDALDCEGRVVSLGAPFLVRVFDLPAAVARGDELEVVAQLAPARRIRDPDLPDPRPAEARRAVAYTGGAVAVLRWRAGGSLVGFLDATRARLRDGIERALPPDVAPIARALVLGEEDLAAADDEAFRTSGLTHLLAVSGSHVALVVGGLVALLRWLFLRVEPLARRLEAGRLAALVGIPLALAYEQLAGDSGSARRATAMAALVLLVRASGRKADTVRVLGASTLAALLVDPLAPFDLSFALSLAATVGLVGLAPPLRAALDRRVPWAPAGLRATAAATAAASVACAPFVARIAGALPTLGLLANLVAVPIGELAALPLANAAAVVGALAGGAPSLEPLARLIGRVAAGAIVALRAVARGASSLSALPVPSPDAWELAIVVGTATALYVAARSPRRAAGALALGAAALLLVEGGLRRAGAPHGELRITFLDVGQGDSALIDLPDGSAVLVDGGGEVGSPFDPGRAIVGPVLAARRRGRLDVAILTHPHPDHFGGLASALPALDVGALWDSGEGEARQARQAESGERAPGPYVALLATLRRRGTRIVRPDELCAGPRRLGGATFEVLSPCPSFDRDRGANDNSLVVRIGFGRRHALLVGDAEHGAEAALLRGASASRLRADVLKIGHHGSRTSTTRAFLDAVAPTFAAISCGVRNRFGHPHPNTLATLRDAHVPYARTDRDGAIRWATDGERISIATARAGW
jgi:competence protein ComEC